MGGLAAGGWSWRRVVEVVEYMGKLDGAGRLVLRKGQSNVYPF